MRLWSLHPRYLDRQGLTAAWREALLAQAVLAGRTRGYTRHPQLTRLRATPDPLAAVGAYLSGLHVEATSRGYSYDEGRVDLPDHDHRWAGSVEVTTGQLSYEWEHLLRKLVARSPDRAQALRAEGPAVPDVHPVFSVVPGPVAEWEVVAAP